MPYVDLHPDRGFPHAMVLLAALEASVVPTAGLSAVQLMLAVFERAGIEAHLEDFRDLEGAARIGGLQGLGARPPRLLVREEDAERTLAQFEQIAREMGDRTETGDGGAVV